MGTVGFESFGVSRFPPRPAGAPAFTDGGEAYAGTGGISGSSSSGGHPLLVALTRGTIMRAGGFCGAGGCIIIKQSKCAN